jgi:pimeloyl-ACP methyl ester carboxylesterase
MDLPLHGISPKLPGATPVAEPFLGFSVDKAFVGGEFIDNPLFPTANERHFGWGQNAVGQPTRMVYSTDVSEALGSSAQNFLNLGNLPVARDNNRQGVVDLLNLNASLVNLNDIDLDTVNGADDVRIDFDIDPNTGSQVYNATTGSKVYYVGHSLGGILGTPFVAIANDAAQDATLGNSNIVPIQAAAMVTPGAGIAKLLENSPGIGATVLAGLAQSGLTQGTSNLELYLNVAQALLDSSDPNNFVDSLKTSGTKLYINEIYGDGSDTSTQDQTIPVAADTAYAGQYTAPLGQALPAPLAGTEPLIALLESDTISASGPLAANANAVRFNAGTHTTIISADNELVFGEMATNIISFFSTGGTALSFINGTTVLQSDPTVNP